MVVIVRPMNLSSGTTVRVRGGKVIHRSGGSAWGGDKGTIRKVTGDGYEIDFGGWMATVVKDDEVERA